MPASTLAATRPRRVRGLILAMAYGRAVIPAGADIEQVLASARPNEEAPPVDFLAQLAPSRVGDARFRQWWSSAGRRGASPAVAQTLLALNASGDVTALVPLIEARTLVIRRPDFRGPIFGAFFAPKGASRSDRFYFCGPELFPALLPTLNKFANSRYAPGTPSGSSRYSARAT